MVNFYTMYGKELKKVIAGLIGHKVDEICASVNTGYSKYVRFRHETYAYSEIELREVNGNIVGYLKNFETGDMEEVGNGY